MSRGEKLSFVDFMRDIRYVVTSPARRFAVIQERGSAWGSLLLLIVPTYIAFYYFGGLLFKRDPFPGYSFIPPLALAIAVVYLKLYLIHWVARRFLGKGRSEPDRGIFRQLKTVFGYTGVPALLAALLAVALFMTMPEGMGYAVRDFQVVSVSIMVGLGIALFVWNLILVVLALRTVYPMRDLKLVASLILGSILMVVPALGTLWIAAPASVEFIYVQPILSSRILHFFALDPTTSISANTKIGIHVDRLVYRFTSPDHFDLVAYRRKHPQAPKVIQETVAVSSGLFLSLDVGGCLLGRVVGCPGDSVELIKGNLYVNNEPWDERYLLPGYRSDVNLPRITLGPSQYCVLPENRRLIDSMRDELVVERNQILGREMIARWPLGWWSLHPNVFLQARPSK
jgi:signal peptidase I